MHYMEPEFPLQCVQEPVTVLSSASISFTTPLLILSFHLHRGLPSYHFPSIFFSPQHSLRVFFSPIHATTLTYH